MATRDERIDQPRQKYGATPREALEVILQTTIYAGMPRCLRAAAILERILKEQGRIGELTDTQLPLPAGVR